MKILLLNSYLTTLPDDPASPSAALSLGYLASYVERYYDVKVLDIAAEGKGNTTVVGDKLRVGLSDEEIKKRILSFSPDIVGITAPSTLHSQDAYDVARIVKSSNENILVVVGGAHASSNPKIVLGIKEIDIVVKGEGEETFLDICRRFDEQKTLNDIPGTCIRTDKGVIINKPREIIKDLDAIPFPARHLLPMDIYFKGLKDSVNYVMRDKVATMITSRGCPGKCIYCAVKTVWGRRWRGRSAKNVVDEIEYLMSEYGVGEVHFLDDSMSVNKDRLMAICDEIIDRKLDIKWTTPNGIALWLLNEPLIKKMKKAGCYRLTFGLESGNADTLKFLGKKYNYDHALEIIKYAHKVGLWTIGTFILGSPYEKIDSIRDSINLAKRSYLDFAVFYIANPFPGTEMYKIFEREGLLRGVSGQQVVRGVDTINFTNAELVEIQGNAFSEFMKEKIYKPWRIFPKLRSLEDFTYALKLAGRFLKMGINPLNFRNKGIASLWKK